MKIILLEDIKNLGKKNDVVEVSDGYAKNFLIKQKKAVAYTNASKTRLEEDLLEIEQNEQELIVQMSLLKEKLESTPIFFKLVVNDGKTFGNISNKQIIDAINGLIDHAITKHMITKSHALSIGEHIIPIQLHKKVIANVKVIVEEA
ncbi:50S ribosomal protein L9 [Ureaplasma canigenitalium]|uniref:50S ribosomal protein L9 n=1 Tax=Ureaplasma canigenitalium TaxID=42092 RepID=UPI0004E28CA2|nr:50S ribosomal protein L9 [Ureaplasma canigenitalium]